METDGQPEPLVTIRYEGTAMEVSFGLRPPDSEHGEAGYDAVLNGLAIATGVIIASVSQMDAKFLGQEAMERTHRMFWGEVQKTLDKTLMGEVERG